MEPRAATPERRLETIAALAEAGVPVGVLSAPMIPALNDSEMEAILERALRRRRAVAGYTLLRLPLELKALFKEWLEEHAPNKAAHVLSLVAQCHGGRLYDSAWSKRMVGGGPYAEMLAARFDRACRRLGFRAAHHPGARHQPLPPAAAKGRSARAVLIGCGREACHARASRRHAGGRRGPGTHSPQRPGKGGSKRRTSRRSSAPSPRSCGNCRPTPRPAGSTRRAICAWPPISAASCAPPATSATCCAEIRDEQNERE